MKNVVLKYDMELECWTAFFVDRPDQRATAGHQATAIGNLIFMLKNNLGIKILYQQQ